MIIENMDKKHLNGVLKVEESCFTHPWSKESFESELKKSESFKFVALEEDEVIGFAILEAVLDEGNLLDIAVDENHRRKGVARLLFEEMLEKAKENELSFITLEVRSSSTPAIALYEAMGFEKVGVRKNYYNKPTEDALLMTKYFKKD